jgi:hypothetical protein
MLHRAVFLRADVSEESIAFIFRVNGIRELGTALAVSNNCNMIRRNANLSSHYFLKQFTQLITVLLSTTELDISEYSTFPRPQVLRNLHQVFI